MTTSIFNMPSPTSSSPFPKVHFTHSTISPKYLDPSQPPTKTNPFQQINNIPFVRDLRICMPLRLWESLYPDNGSPQPTLKYSKLTATLRAILDNETLRRGNYLFLSNANDNIISFSRGTLTMTMPQHIYQRSGLTFPTTKLQSGSRKHDPRALQYRVEVDLRAPSMVRGKKGFDRVMYAARHVEGVKEEREWLVYEFEDGKGGGGGKKRKREEDVGDGFEGSEEGDGKTPVGRTGEHPLLGYTPKITTTQGVRSSFRDVLVPTFLRDPSFFSTIQPKAMSQHSQKANLPMILEEDVYDIIEYLSLIFHQSPRIVQSQYGKVDPYLCQYTLPNVSLASSISNADVEIDPNDPETTEASEDLRLITYTGFIPSAFVTQVLVDILRRSRSMRISNAEPHPWVALNVVAQPAETTSSSDGLMIVLQSDNTNHSEGDLGAVSEGSDKTIDSAHQRTMQPDSSEPGRLRYATCFEFVDTMTG